MRKEVREGKQTEVFGVEDVERVWEAFETFYMLGEARILSDVSKDVELPEATLASWHEIFHWEERVKLWDQLFADKVEAEGRRVIREAPVLCKELLGTMIVDSFAEYQDRRREAKRDGRPVPGFIRSLKDLERVWQLYQSVPDPPPQDSLVLHDDERLARVSKLLEANEQAQQVIADLWRGAAGDDAEK
jgi:hypothetical protein